MKKIKDLFAFLVPSENDLIELFSGLIIIVVIMWFVSENVLVNYIGYAIILFSFLGICAYLIGKMKGGKDE